MPGLFTSVTEAQMVESFVPLNAWKPFPLASDREAWEDWKRSHLLSERQAAFVSGRAEGICGTNPMRYTSPSISREIWPELTAAEYMRYIRTGDRSGYEGPYFHRRTNLAFLTMAECMEGTGRYLDEIINGLWAMCSEPTWCVPAHVARLRKDGVPSAFPDLSQSSVDLFNSETGFALAECVYLLRDRLEEHAPGVCEWVDRLIDERILTPVEQKESGWWWFDGRNNWTPWCCTNVLACALYTLQDSARAARITSKLLAALQKYYDRYNEDGGCDEGPMYWGASPGALILTLEMLHSRSNGKIDVYGDPKIQAMGRYIARVRLSGGWFTNFADAGSGKSMKRAAIYRYGERIGDRPMQELALLSSRDWEPENPVWPLVTVGHCCADLMGMLREFWWMKADDLPVQVRHPLSTWFPDLEVGILRTREDETRGMILAVKGGHNDENHNHNDVGQFILMLDGRPAIVDVGIGVYTRLNFSDKRYSLWMTRGAGHNLPVVNGYEQTEGRERKAEQVVFAADAPLPFFSLEAAGLYPEGAGMKSLQRHLELDRSADTVRLRDSFALTTAPVVFTYHFYTPRQVARLVCGDLLLRDSQGRSVLLQPSVPAELSISEAPIAGDRVLETSWPDGLSCVSITVRMEQPEGCIEFLFSPQ